MTSLDQDKPMPGAPGHGAAGSAPAAMSALETFLRSPFTAIRLPGRPPVQLATDSVRAKPAVAPQLSMMIGMTAIGLGVWGTFFPGSVKRSLGVTAPTEVVRAVFGAREMWSGYSLAGDPTRVGVLWARVGADLFDIAVLGSLTSRSNDKRANAKWALGFVLAVTGLDLITALRMSTVKRNCA